MQCLDCFVGTLVVDCRSEEINHKDYILGFDHLILINRHCIFELCTSCISNGSTRVPIPKPQLDGFQSFIRSCISLDPQFPHPIGPGIIILFPSTNLQIYPKFPSPIFTASIYQLTNPAFLLNPPLTIVGSVNFPSKIVFFTIPSTFFGATLANQIPCPSFFL